MYLYQCYVTGPWWQCDDPVTVERDVKKAWNPDSHTITISTDSEAVSKEEVNVEFFGSDYSDAAGGYAGGVYIGFETEIKYYIEYCTEAYTSFPAALPTETKKTWTITYNYTDKRLVFHCNGVQVLNVVLSSECDNSSWRDFWKDYYGKKPVHIKFNSWYDTASDTYCISSNHGKYNGVIDSGE